MIWSMTPVEVVREAAEAVVCGRTVASLTSEAEDAVNLAAERT